MSDICRSESLDESSWYNFAVSPADRNARHEAYDCYIVIDLGH